MQKLKDLISKSCEAPKAQISSNCLANLHKKQYPLNIRLRFKAIKSPRPMVPIIKIPEFAEEYLKERTPKRYKIRSRIDNRLSYEISRSPGGCKTPNDHMIENKTTSSLIFDSFRTRLNASLRESTSPPKKSRLLIKSSQKNEEEKIFINAGFRTHKNIRHKKETKLSDNEAKINEKIQKLKEIIKDPLIYGLD